MLFALIYLKSKISPWLISIIRVREDYDYIDIIFRIILVEFLPINHINLIKQPIGQIGVKPFEYFVLF